MVGQMRLSHLLKLHGQNANQGVIMKYFLIILWILAMGICICLLADPSHAAGEYYVISKNPVVNSENSSGGCGGILDPVLEHLRLEVGHIKLGSCSTLRDYGNGEKHAHIKNVVSQPLCVDQYCVYEIPYGYSRTPLQLDGKKRWESNKSDLEQLKRKWEPKDVETFDHKGVASYTKEVKLK